MSGGKKKFTPILHALETGNQDQLSGLIDGLNPSTLANLISDLEVKKRNHLFNTLMQADRLATLRYLDEDVQLSIIQDLPDSEARTIIEKMPHDERVDLLEKFSETKRHEILRHLASKERDDIAELSKYPEGTVGSIMTSDYAMLPPEITAGEAIEKLRIEAPDHELIYYAYVVDNERKLVGTVSMRTLLLSDPAIKVGDIITKDVEKVSVNETAEKASRKLKRLHLLALPVVDDNKLVGMITFDDAMEAIEEDVSDTMYSKAGIQTGTTSRDRARDILYSKKLTQGPIWYPIRLRILFLFVTLAGGFLVGGIIDNFEDLLSAVIVAAVFIPVIMDMGGNVGTQSTTIFARGLALGHVKVANIWKHIAREMSIGVSMGLILGVIGGTVAYFWQGLPNGIPEIGIAVAISLAVVVPLATFLGFFLPYVLLKMGWDHAPGADPFITTIKDFVGLALYFTLVSVLIGV